MTAMELLFDVRDRFGLSTRDMARIMDVRDSTMEKWCAGKGEPKDIAEIIQIEHDILWLAAYLDEHPELDKFCYAHFKAAINKLSLDTIDCQ